MAIYDEDDELEFDPESQSGMSQLETPDNIANLPVSEAISDIEPISATDDPDFLEEARKSQPKPAKMDSDDDLESEVAAANPAAPQAAKPDFTPEENAQVQAGLDGMTQSLQNPMATSQNPALTRYQQFMDEYKRLQERRASDQRLIGLMSAGSSIGQSIAGGASGNFKVDPNAYAMAEKIANRPVEDFEQGQTVQSRQMQLKTEMDLNDPASPKSVLIRNYLRDKLKIDLADDVSAADAQELIKTIGRPSTSGKGGQVVRVFDEASGKIKLKAWNPASMELTDLNETAGFALQPRSDNRTKESFVFNPASGNKEKALTAPTPAPKESSEEAPLITKENLTVDQRQSLDKVRDKLMDDTKDDRTALQTARGIKMTVESGDKIGGDILREIQNQLARASGEKGAMTEGDVKEFGGRQGVLDRIERNFSIWTTGKIPAEDRAFLSKIADRMEKRSQMYVKNRSQYFTTTFYGDLKASPNLKNAAMNEKSVERLLGLDAILNSAPESNEYQDPTIVKYAQEHFDNNYDKAKFFLEKSRGYKPKTAGR